MSFSPGTWYCCCGTRNSNALSRCRVCQTPRGASRLTGLGPAANPQATHPVSERSPGGLQSATYVLGALAVTLVIAAGVLFFTGGRAGSSSASLTGGSFRLQPTTPPAPPLLASNSNNRAVKSPSPLGVAPSAPEPVEPPLTAAPLPDPPEAPSPAVPEGDLPPGPSLVSAPHSEGLPGLPPILNATPADPPNTAPVASSSGWQEHPIQQETPELRLRKQSDAPLMFALKQNGAWRHWPVNDIWYQRIAPGEYEYAVFGPFYTATGRPDMAGTLRCRRFRMYEVTFILSSGNSTRYVDLGDQ